MKTSNRIPVCKDDSFDGMLVWFATLSQEDLLFHPDDDPATIVSADSGEKAFSRAEVRSLWATLARLFRVNGDNVYEAAYPIFMTRFGIQLDA